MTTADVAIEVAETAGQGAARLAYEAQRIKAFGASFAAGRVVPMSAVRAWIECIDPPNELPPPHREFHDDRWRK
jgi:hypothetical protein